MFRFRTGVLVTLNPNPVFTYLIMKLTYRHKCFGISPVDFLQQSTLRKMFCQGVFVGSIRLFQVCDNITKRVSTEIDLSVKRIK